MKQHTTRAWLGRAALALCSTLAALALLSTPLQAQSGFPTAVLQNGLSGFEQPLFVGHAGDGSGRLFVVEQKGRVRIVKNGQLVPAPFIDISDRVLLGSERGLLGLAFAPDYATSGYFYLYYTSSVDDGDGPGDITISRFSRGATADQANPASELPLLTIEHSSQGNHNGGMIAFGPSDGFLYIATGDGGGGNDPDRNAQNPSSLLGKLLRIDVVARQTPQAPLTRRYLPLAQRVRTAGNGDQVVPAQLPYAIPASNPFLTGPATAPRSGHLGCVTHGASRSTETPASCISQMSARVRGKKWIWSRQAAAAVSTMAGRLSKARTATPRLAQAAIKVPIRGPVTSYGRGEGASVTGGYVYRGTRTPALSGIYVFGDFSSGQIWGLRRNAAGVWVRGLLLEFDSQHFELRAGPGRRAISGRLRRHAVSSCSELGSRAEGRKSKVESRRSFGLIVEIDLRTVRMHHFDNVSRSTFDLRPSTLMSPASVAPCGAPYPFRRTCACYTSAGCCFCWCRKTATRSRHRRSGNP